MCLACLLLIVLLFHSDFVDLSRHSSCVPQALESRLAAPLTGLAAFKHHHSNGFTALQVPVVHVVGVY